MEGVQTGLPRRRRHHLPGHLGHRGGNHAQLAAQIAEQAKRAVLAEKHAVVGDEEAFQGQAAARSSAESFTSTVSRPINI